MSQLLYIFKQSREVTIPGGVVFTGICNSRNGEQMTNIPFTPNYASILLLCISISFPGWNRTCALVIRWEKRQTQSFNFSFHCVQFGRASVLSISFYSFFVWPCISFVHQFPLCLVWPCISFDSQIAVLLLTIYIIRSISSLTIFYSCHM